MPSIILTGHPCTGKTSFARLLAARALRHPSSTITRVIHIRESTACPDQTKAECYSNSHAEKTTRASLKSEFDRAVMSKAEDTLVILDSLNYIKGYRYELYCISKAAGARHGTVWITGGSSDGGCSGMGAINPSDELAKKRNRQRKELQTKPQRTKQATSVENDIDLDGYYEDDGTMDALVLRFEPPDDKNRWENPLYKVDVTNCLPWTNDGTTLKVSPDPNHLGTMSDEKKPANPPFSQNEERSNLMASQIQGMEVKDVSGSPNEPEKPARKSGSGFKRRGKKSAQQGSTKQQPQPKTSTVMHVVAPKSVPSSMASRTLTPGASVSVHAESSEGSKPNIEDVIDGILQVFLMDVAPLREGMSTLKHDFAESNVLNQVDNLTQRINDRILKAQQSTPLSTGVGGKIFISLSAVSGGSGDGEHRAMNLSKPLYVNELRTFRRQFLKWIAGHPMSNGTKEDEIVGAYISFIESHI